MSGSSILVAVNALLLKRLRLTAEAPSAGVSARTAAETAGLPGDEREEDGRIRPAA